MSVPVGHLRRGSDNRDLDDMKGSRWCVSPMPPFSHELFNPACVTRSRSLRNFGRCALFQGPISVAFPKQSPSFRNRSYR
jgi:hypothetical protein